MSSVSFSQWLEQVTEPEHPYYHPTQLTLFAGLSYVGTACLSSISPVRGMALATVAYTISQLLTPLFCQLFESKQDWSLVHLMGQVLQLSTSLILAKVICFIIGHSLSFKEIREVSLIFLVSLYVSRLALIKFRRQLEGS